MNKRFPTLFFLLYATTTLAQNDSLPHPALPNIPERIAIARRELLASFLADDPAAAGLWRDSLMQLESNDHAALVWDERWMLYLWEESYGNLFDEAVRFDETERQRLATKQPPPKDSLFEWLDNVLYERRFDLYESIGRGFLSEEEKQFAFIEMDYLLRLNQQEQASGEWNKRLDAFLKLHPDSRFKPYIKANLYTQASDIGHVQIRKDRGFGLDVLFASGRWRDELERTAGSPYGFDLGLFYWQKRWNFGIRCLFAFQKLSRAVFENGNEWPKNDPTVFIAPMLEVGFNIVNNQKLKVIPSVGAGISILKPPSPDEEEDDPPPDYYSDFFFSKGFLSAALTADVKLKQFELEEEDVSYIGVRLRLGYNRLYLGNDNPALQGNMFFFAIGVNLSGHAIH